MSGLTPATFYYAWVRTNCGGGDIGAWSFADSFWTSCSATALNVPYSQDFEAVTPPALPPCITTENAGTGNDWLTVNAPPGYGFNNVTMEYPYNSSNAANAWFYTPGINLTAGTSYRLSFKYGNNSNTYTENLEVKYGISPSHTDMSDLIVDYPAISLLGSANSATDFVPVVSGVYYIGFHAYSAADQYFLYVDEISVTLTPTFPVLFSSFTGQREGSANRLSWTSSTEANNRGFEI